MRELAIAGVWLFISGALWQLEDSVPANYYQFMARGKWVALVLAVINALRPAVKWMANAAVEKIRPDPYDPNYDDQAPVQPIFRDEPPDDRIQPPPPPPGAIKP